MGSRLNSDAVFARVKRFAHSEQAGTDYGARDVAVAESPAEVEAALRRAHEALRFRIEPA